MKPFQLFREMRRNCSTNLNPVISFFKKLFLERLPLNIQMILIAKAYSNTEELAEKADKLVAVSGNGSGSVYAVRDHVTDLRRLALNARARVALDSKHLLFSVTVRNSVYRLADAVPLADILGKRTARDLMAVGSPGNRSRCLFFVQERKYGMRFLVDTGLEVSVVPLSTTRCSQLHTSDIPRLTAANVTPIDVVGSRELTVDEGITRPMSWKFIVARIRQRILRADFLRHFNLLFNRFDHQLPIDMTYGLSRMDLSRSAKQNPSVVYGANETTNSKFLKSSHLPPHISEPVSVDSTSHPDAGTTYHDGCRLTDWNLRVKSSTSFSVSSDHQAAVGHHHFTWFENQLNTWRSCGDYQLEKIEDFADKSQRYALQKGFFGLILLSGYRLVPNENHFWSTADDVCVSIVPRVMARNKFKNVKRYFHLFGVFQEKLSIDESMGGVDTMDMHLSMVAAWRLHCELHDADRSAMTHLAFRRDITAHLLRARPLQISRPGPRIHLPHSLRSSRGHFLQSLWQTAVSDMLPIISSPGRYLIPNFNDFVTQLSGRTIFSEIPVAEEIPKAAITTSFSLYEYCSLTGVVDSPVVRPSGSICAPGVSSPRGCLLLLK
ncbi:hypothetical protein T09_13292 [Trichinella sp. T9]|nr:hypothetical protein T09_13292 [Trichinella sp. T9]